jgi:hypothetical protein
VRGSGAVVTGEKILDISKLVDVVEGEPAEDMDTS